MASDGTLGKPRESVSGKNKENRVLSGNDGEYVINLLPVGNYAVRVEHAGFRTDERASIELRINGHVRLDFVLRVGSVSEKIEVKGSAPLVDTDTAESGEVIENQRVTQLPRL